jgi:hypothetical protein
LGYCKNIITNDSSEHNLPVTWAQILLREYG